MDQTYLGTLASADPLYEILSSYLCPDGLAYEATECLKWGLKLK